MLFRPLLLLLLLLMALMCGSNAAGVQHGSNELPMPIDWTELLLSTHMHSQTHSFSLPLAEVSEQGSLC